jgi:hypothetical protein
MELYSQMKSGEFKQRVHSVLASTPMTTSLFWRLYIFDARSALLCNSAKMSIRLFRVVHKPDPPFHQSTFVLNP